MFEMSMMMMMMMDKGWQSPPPCCVLCVNGRVMDGWTDGRMDGWTCLDELHICIFGDAASFFFCMPGAIEWTALLGIDGLVLVRTPAVELSSVITA